MRYSDFPPDSPRGDDGGGILILIFFGLAALEIRSTFGDLAGLLFIIGTIVFCACKG